MIESPYLTSDEAIQYLRMEAKWAKKVLFRWIKQKRINAYRRGNQYIFTQDQLDAFVSLNGRNR